MKYCKTMKKTFYIIAAFFVLCMLPSCLGDDEPETYEKWRKENEKWIDAKAAEKDESGANLYERINSAWDNNGYVLMRWHNDRSLTEKNLSPLSTSTIDVKYQVQDIDSVMIDNSYSRTTPADSVYRTQLNKNLSGWVIALSAMHVGDSCTIIIPYSQAYGAREYGKAKPYSNLIFQVRLLGIPGYQTDAI